MIGVDQPIEINQFYDGPGPSTYLFERILFKDILVFGAQGVSDDSPSLDQEAEVQFDCDNHVDGKANCHVRMENVQFSGYGQRKASMSCKGVEGTVSHLSGIDSCLHTRKP